MFLFCPPEVESLATPLLGGGFQLGFGRDMLLRNWKRTNTNTNFWRSAPFIYQSAQFWAKFWPEPNFFFKVSILKIDPFKYQILHNPIGSFVLSTPHPRVKQLYLFFSHPTYLSAKIKELNILTCVGYSIVCATDDILYHWKRHLEPLYHWEPKWIAFGKPYLH